MGEKNLFRRLREAQMWTKTELARKAGVSVLTIDRVERGLPCRLSTQRKILLALGMNLEEVRRVLQDKQTGPEIGAEAQGWISRIPDSSLGKDLPLEGLSVLIVDDEQGVRELLKGRLRHWGCRVDVASDGEEAVKVYRAWRPYVVLMDLEMPGKDGIKAAQDIVSMDPSARIILMTGSWDTAPARKALERNLVKVVLAKPFDADQLQMALREVAPKGLEMIKAISEGGAVA